jgi:hypothetical protein
MPDDTRPAGRPQRREQIDWSRQPLGKIPDAADHIAALLRIVGQAELDAERGRLAEAERLLEEAGS